MTHKSRPNQPLITLGGITGSGKTALAIKLVQKHPKLVILSADSRQVYRRLDIGTGKVGQPAFDASLTGRPEPVWVQTKVPQFLLDIAKPNTTFTLADYLKEARRLLEAAWTRDRIPLLVGGTGLYLQAVAEGFHPVGRPGRHQRAELARLPLAELRRRAAAGSADLNPSDWNNPYRLVRAIERGSPPPNQPLAAYSFVLERPWPEQLALAPATVADRLAAGLVSETEKLLVGGVDRAWLKNLGLSYRQVIRYLDQDLSRAALEPALVAVFRDLMKRQKTWFDHHAGVHGDTHAIQAHLQRLIQTSSSIGR